ncbi:MAG: type II toxin-antitoxin system ParD family antitoxin [Phycisphaerales bacterium]|nr:type II toxin-antitoxin system ParD family antitoxin [Phycisphaerales bacterium]
MADPSTVTMNVSLTEVLKRYVDGKVSSGVYGSASEFVREAIREKLLREQDREQAKAALASKLIEGLDSGTPVPFTDSYAPDKVRALGERIKASKSKR